MRNIKIAVHPGEVMSKSDGQVHYIGARRLAELHGLSPDQWFLWDDAKENTYKGKKEEEYYHVYPLYDGRYSDLGKALRENKL